MERVCGAGFEFQSFVPSPCLLVLGMDKEGSDANNFCSGGGSEQSILDERLANASPLLRSVNSQTGKQHHGDRMPGQPLAHPDRRFGVLHRSSGKAVKGDHRRFPADDIGSGAVGALICKGKSLQKVIERLLPALEGVNFVRFVKFFDRRQTPVSGYHSRTLFSENSRARRGLFTTGRSRIF